VTPERERDLERICQSALELPAADRAGFLNKACGGDDGLRREVESLLAQDVPSSFLETPALAVAAHGLVGHNPAQGLSLAGPALAVGQQIGHYTILSPLGSGGMGEVYRARDVTLGRDVAIKVLPSLFTSDPERLARFEREARILASVNHPNVATIHGVEHVDGIHALVLEVVEGETLGERLRSTASGSDGRRSRSNGDRRPQAGLPVSDALTIARQIADALEVAHEKGVIHRDLKPANIKIRPDGVVKVLDFGLAKAVAGDRSMPDASEPPTMTAAGTRDGIVLGTAAYMSPEQARGEAVDKRTDIWAFGCVLYEMLAGRGVFAAASTTETLSEVLKSEPDWQCLPVETPIAVKRLLRRCLAKDRSRRLSDMHDARLDLDETPGDAPADARLASHAHRFRRLAWAAALALLVTAVAAAGLVWRGGTRTSPTPMQVRFDIDVPPTSYPDSLAISPDGRAIVYAATSDDGRSQLWLRALDASSAQPLAGAKGGRRPFWSPDSRAIGFFADVSLKRMDIETGTVLRLADVQEFREGTWSDNGTILFTAFGGSGVLRVSDRGSDPVAVEIASATGGNPQSPRFLPGGRRFLYNAGPVPRAIFVGLLDGSERRRVVDADSAEYAHSGHLLYTRGGALFSQPFDPARFELTGSPVQIAERVIARSVANNGTLVFRSGLTPGRELVWFDRSGKTIGQPVGPGAHPSLSPDGGHVALDRATPGLPPDIWILDVARTGFNNLTVGRWASNSPLWSPDGTSIVFASPRNGKPFGMYERSAAGGEGERLLLQTDQASIPNDWSADGRLLIYRTGATAQDFDLWALSLDDNRTFPLVQTKLAQREAQFSPDGRWFAYQSNESGRFEIYLRPFPDAGRTRIPVSTNGGVQVRWRRDGRELFYFGLDNTLMAVPMPASPTGDTMRPGSPVPLFRANVEAGEGVGVQDYAVSRDGTRFLISRVQEVTAPITVVLNWRPKE
jgi:serine/threonine protein kinase/Tol biopolymer transport system component